MTMDSYMRMITVRPNGKIRKCAYLKNDWRYRKIVNYKLFSTVYLAQKDTLCTQNLNPEHVEGSFVSYGFSALYKITTNGHFTRMHT